MSVINSLTQEKLMKKRTYAMPTVKSVEFKVEVGVEASPSDSQSNNATNPMILYDETTFRSNSVSDDRMNEVSADWF